MTDFDLVPPQADALMESLRATGYSLPDAVADLIDNSITAGARNIWLNFYWAGADSRVSILDDGYGMSEPELTAAMKVGSQSPREEREPTDLGRYGLGLKTASISQARAVTVATRAPGNEGRRLHRRPRAGAPARTRAHARVLGGRRAGRTGLPTAPRAAARPGAASPHLTDGVPRACKRFLRSRTGTK